MSHVQVNIPFHIDQTLALDDGTGHTERRFPASLIYDSREPYTAHLGLTPPELDGEVVLWTFARDLLRMGIISRATLVGEGDVRVSQCTPGRVHIELDSRSDSPEGGIASFHIPVQVVKRYLLRAFAQVPAGTEDQHLGDIDSEYANLCGGTD